MKQVTKVDRTVLWKIITIFSMLITIMAIAAYAFHQRTPIVESITSKKVFSRKDPAGPPSTESAQELQDFVNKHDRVMGIDVVRVNFTNNVRVTTFQASKEEAVNAVWGGEKGQTFPLFTENTIANGRVVSMINGQFVCSPTGESLSGRLFPTINEKSATTCTAAIPPGFGDFIGWVNIYLYEQPTFAQMQTLKNLAEKLTRDMYERDILKGKGNLKGTVNPTIVTP